MTLAVTHQQDQILVRDRRLQPTAITIGPWQSAEFAVALSAVEEQSSLRKFATAEAAFEMLSDAEVAPELILVAQPLPGTLGQSSVDRLQRLAPLARIVGVAGTWCEGELRTGSLPDGVFRLYWYELAPWWRASRRRWVAGICPAWSVPIDQPQAGRYVIDATIDDLTTPAMVAIETDDFAVFECLFDALAAAGAGAIWARENDSQQAIAGIWDGGQLNKRELQRLSRFCQRIEGPVVALLDFPRAEHISQVCAAGAVAVFGKPYIVEEVLERLS